MSHFRLLLVLAGVIWPLAAVAQVPLTLTAARARLLVVAPALLAARADITARAAQARYQTALPDPTLSFGPQNLDVTHPTLAHDNMSAFVVGLSQHFPPFGKLRLTRLGLDAGVRAARLTLADTRAKLVATLTQNFCAYYYGRQALRTLHRNQALYREIVHSARFRYENGHGTLADLLQARYAASGVRDDIARLTATLAMTHATLMQLLAMQRLRIASARPRLPRPPASAVLLAEIGQTPSLAARAAVIQEKREFLRAAHHDLLPTYAIGASYGFRTAPEYPDGPKSPDQFSVEISMSLPIFPNAREDQRIDRRAADLEVARDQESRARLSLMQAVLAAEAALTDADSRLRLLKTQRLPEARGALHAALIAFANGRISLPRTLRYARDVRNEEVTAWQLRSDRARAIATLDYLGTHTETLYAH